jgi:hypothetical protein
LPIIADSAMQATTTIEVAADRPPMKTSAESQFAPCCNGSCST